MDEGRLHEKSIFPNSIKRYNNCNKYLSPNSNNSVYGSDEKKLWMDIELIPKDSDDKNYLYKRSFYRQYYLQTGNNLNNFGGNSRSLDGDLDSSNFILE